MTETVLFLLLDSLTNGLIYAILALSLVLVFTVTRVVNIAQGEYVMLGALTLADLMQRRVPATLYLLVAGLALCSILDMSRLLSDRKSMLKQLGGMVAYLVFAVVLSLVAVRYHFPVIAMMLVGIVLVAPIGPIVYRLTVHPNPNASTIVFVIISVGVAMSLQGLGLALWGPDAMSVQPIATGGTMIGPVFVAWQAFAILIVAVMVMAGLYFFSTRTLLGKALQASAMNRLGAQLCGIPVAKAGALSFLLAAAFSAVSGMLLAPLITANYEMGFIIGLKGFVGGALGGLIDYPLALVGVMLVGALESFSAYTASSFRDVIVFSLLIPILLWRNARQSVGAR